MIESGLGNLRLAVLRTGARPSGIEPSKAHRVSQYFIPDRTQNTDAISERIRAVYDPTLFRFAGEQLARLLADHLERVYAGSGKVLNWNLPEDNIARATDLANGAINPSSSADIVSRFELLVREMLARGHNLHDPRYVGHQVPPPIPLAGLFDAVGSVTNQVMAIYEMGPWATAVELAMVNQLAQYLGWKPGVFAGFVTHGATLANLNALLVARNVAMPGCWEGGLVSNEQRPSAGDPVLVVQADAHYSIARAAGILGLGTKQVIKVGLDQRRRMNVLELDQTLHRLRAEGRIVIAVVACACSTPIGAFDPLGDVADVCERHHIWLHVDSAHGGSVLLSDKHRQLADGLERADSLVWDAHKMLFVPALCAFLFFKQKRHSFEAFHQNAPYLFDPTDPGSAEYDLGLRTVECTKRAAAFGLWGIWSIFGPQLFADLIDVTFDLTRRLYKKLRTATDFETIHEPQCNILAFRCLPNELRGSTSQQQGEFQRRLRRRVIESGAFYLVAANIDGMDVLRVTLMNPLTTAEHLDQLLETLRATGRELLSRPKDSSR